MGYKSHHGSAFSCPGSLAPPSTNRDPRRRHHQVKARKTWSPNGRHYPYQTDLALSHTMDGYYMYHGQPSQQAAGSVSTSSYRPSKPEDWEPYRDIIAHLYNTLNMKLKDVMAEMQATYSFKATEKQYKTQLKKWNLDTKYIKGSEYMFMIKTMRERQAMNPPRETRFILRGRIVDPKDIARFEKRAQKKGILREGEPIVCDEPVEDLVYGTPPPEEASYHQAAYAEAYSTYQYDSGTDYAYSY